MLTNLLIDTIKSSAPSRIINVSSRAHLGKKEKIISNAYLKIFFVFSLKKQDGKINWDELNMQNTKMNKEFISKFYSEKNFKPFVAYAQSKLANVLFSIELARRYKGNLKILII